MMDSILTVPLFLYKILISPLYIRKEFSMYAFITGASSGIGRELSILLAQKGYHLILIGRRKKRLLALKEKLESLYSIQVEINAVDISIEANCKALLSQYASYPIEIVINNAGFGTLGYLSEQDIDNALMMIKTNVIAPHIFTHYFAKHMKQGYILNVSSIAAFTHPPYFSTYGATKSYLYALSTAVNYEMKKQHKKISVTTLCPGSVQTEFYRNGGKQPAIGILSARTCANLALKGMFQKKALIIPTAGMKGTYLLTKLLPQNIMLPIQYFLQKKKKE